MARLMSTPSSKRLHAYTAQVVVCQRVSGQCVQTPCSRIPVEWESAGLQGKLIALDNPIAIVEDFRAEYFVLCDSIGSRPSPVCDAAGDDMARHSKPAHFELYGRQCEARPTPLLVCEYPLEPAVDTRKSSILLPCIQREPARVSDSRTRAPSHECFCCQRPAFACSSPCCFSRRALRQTCSSP